MTIYEQNENKQRVTVLQDKIELMEITFSELDKENVYLRRQVNHLDNYSRRNTE